MGTFARFEARDDWEAAWNGAPLRRQCWPVSKFREVAHYVGGAMSTVGFKLFENGGLPLMERWAGSFREEILLMPAPSMDRRTELPFSIRVHLSSAEVARVRGRYWRPPLLAPNVVAAGDLGQLEAEEVRILWFGASGVETAEAVLAEIRRTALPWFAGFANRQQLKEAIYKGPPPLIDDCTALELLLAEFDPFEARRYLRSRMMQPAKVGAIVEPSGFDLPADRLAPIAAYYRL